MNRFTKAVKSLAAKYNETSLILRIAIGLFIGAVLALICPGAVWLEEFGSHNDTPLSSGTIVTGRVCYDAFVLDNKKTGIYYQATT